MKLPNCHKAFIPIEKLKDYLISITHPVGRSKAMFFRSLGFNENNYNLLEESLLTIVRNEEIKETISSRYGVKYVVDGLIWTPTGDHIKMRTIWIVESGSDIPRFVTAYPV